MVLYLRVKRAELLLSGSGLLLQGAGSGAVLVVLALGRVFQRAAAGDFILQAEQHRAQLGGFVGVRMVRGAADRAGRIKLQGAAQGFHAVGAGGFGGFEGALGLDQRGQLGGYLRGGSNGGGVGGVCAVLLDLVLLRQLVQPGALVVLLGPQLLGAEQVLTPGG